MMHDRKGNIGRVLLELTPEEREVIETINSRWIGAPPERLGFVSKHRMVREVQIWALDKPMGDLRWVKAEVLIKKLGGKNLWDPL